ncbi:MAG: chemotaxis protein CheW [Rivularia sp. ALOHA_DT_140]|nr:chemotaxis protein CheW [Rivularia sp. ALOHA_DT_140]
MLFLLLAVDGKRYALESQKVVEVLPLVCLEMLPHSPEYIAGIFNYRGQIVPVIDLCQLMRDKPCCEHFSTRIILIKHYDNGSENSSQSPKHSIFGLIAERVTDTLQKSETELMDANIQIDAAPYLDKIIVQDTEMIQCIHLDYLLSKVERVHFLPKAKL